MLRTQPFAIPALLLLVAGLPLVLGMVPPNRLYGFRTRKTLSDDGVWYRVNRFAGWAAMLAGGMYGVVALERPYDPAAGDFATWGLHVAAFALPIALGLGLAARYARRL
jgi:uncharacterized membrane protein